MPHNGKASHEKDDDSQTFGDAVKVNTWTAYMGIVNDSLVQLENGRIICPVYYSQGPCWTPREHYVARMCLSDDGGRTWRAAETEVDCPKRGAMEPVVVERKDGSLLMLIRTQMGRVYQSTSSDAGNTWTKAEPSVLPSQEAPITARMIPGTDNMLLVWNAGYDAHARSHGGRRSPLHVAVTDAALTQAPTPMPLESSDEATFSYAGITFAHDRALLTYYVGQDHALVGGTRKTFLSLRFRALDLAAPRGKTP